MTKKGLEQFLDVERDKPTDDLIGSAIAPAVGLLTGFVQSHFNPLTLYDSAKRIRSGVDSLTNFNFEAFNLAGYAGGIAFIANTIAENPENPSSYVPLILNGVGLIARGIYKATRKD